MEEKRQDTLEDKQSQCAKTFVFVYFFLLFGNVCKLLLCFYSHISDFCLVQPQNESVVRSVHSVVNLPSVTQSVT